MIFNILKDGEVINTIVASKEFATRYAEKYGYTAELVPEPDDPVTPEPTLEEKYQALEEQLATTQDAVDFILMNM